MPAADQAPNRDGTTLTTQSLLAELDTTLHRAPDSWRRAALRGVSELFFSATEIYSDEQIGLFDDVMCRLIQDMDRSLLAELSNRLASAGNAPVKVAGLLARHLDAAIHGPILSQAMDLAESDLVAIAESDRTGLNQLMKIAARPHLSEAVTDALLKRGDAAIQFKIVENPNARVSEAGFARMIMGLKGDKALAQAISMRSDVPQELRLWLNVSP